MNYQSALRYLNRFINYEQSTYYNYQGSYNLDSIKRLLLAVGNPQKSFFPIVVAGTKGKGSTCAILNSILTEAGISTGIFTSPHLLSVCERINVNRRVISEYEFASILLLIKKAIAKNSLQGLTYFEILTAVGFLYFAKKHIDVAILEVGLGGRLDATNVAPSRLQALTPISFDHTHLLGNSLKKITGEKCGIIKNNSFVVCATQSAKAKEVIQQTASAKKAKLVCVGRDLKASNIKISLLGTSFDVTSPSGQYKGMHVPLVGGHQVGNALVALGVVDILKKEFGFSVATDAIRTGIKKASLPGRFQIVSNKPYIILDGAQNGASAIALKDTLLRIFKGRRIFLLLGVSSDKDADAIGSALCGIAESVIFTKADSLRALSPCLLADRLKKYCKDSFVCYDISDALIFARSLSTKDDIIVISGSLFLVGDTLKEFSRG